MNPDAVFLSHDGGFHAPLHMVNLPVDSHFQTRDRCVHWLRSGQVFRSLPVQAGLLACFGALLEWVVVQIRDRHCCYAGAAVGSPCCLTWYCLDCATLAVRTRLAWEVEGEKTLVAVQRQRRGAGAAWAMT